MRTTLREKLIVKKAARFAIWINVLQMLAIAGVLAYVLITAREQDRYVEIGVLAAAFLIVSWGAVLDIREAFIASRVADQAQMLEEAYGQLEALNGTLRKQRHDFMNHLQVVFSLMELGDSAEAMRYVESVYGDIKKTGSVLKTAIPAVNALIAAKRQDCAEHGIRLDLEIGSGWGDLPVPGWEMCRVLGNLIDNARDALLSSDDDRPKRIALSFGETPASYTFSVTNNGPAIPRSQLADIFRMGFTTKSDGHGSGLAIVSEILSSAGGRIEVTSGEASTCFYGEIPRRAERPVEGE